MHTSFSETPTSYIIIIITITIIIIIMIIIVIIIQDNPVSVINTGIKGGLVIRVHK